MIAYRLVVGFLGSSFLSACLGMTILAFAGREPPQALVTAAVGAMSGLLGILARK